MESCWNHEKYKGSTRSRKGTSVLALLDLGRAEECVYASNRSSHHLQASPFPHSLGVDPVTVHNILKDQMTLQREVPHSSKDYEAVFTRFALNVLAKVTFVPGYSMRRVYCNACLYFSLLFRYSWLTGKDGRIHPE